jgi:hypothetical protein
VVNVSTMSICVSIYIYIYIYSYNMISGTVHQVLMYSTSNVGCL